MAVVSLSRSDRKETELIVVKVKGQAPLSSFWGSTPFSNWESGQKRFSGSQGHGFVLEEIRDPVSYGAINAPRRGGDVPS